MTSKARGVKCIGGWCIQGDMLKVIFNMYAEIGGGGGWELGSHCTLVILLN